MDIPVTALPPCDPIYAMVRDNNYWSYFNKVHEDVMQSHPASTHTYKHLMSLLQTLPGILPGIGFIPPLSCVFFMLHYLPKRVFFIIIYLFIITDSTFISGPCEPLEGGVC